jgi:hypothetical protein
MVQTRSAALQSPTPSLCFPSAAATVADSRCSLQQLFVGTQEIKDKSLMNGSERKRRRRPFPPKHYVATVESLQTYEYPLPATGPSGELHCPEGFVATQPSAPSTDVVSLHHYCLFVQFSGICCRVFNAWGDVQVASPWGKMCRSSPWIVRCASQRQAMSSRASASSTSRARCRSCLPAQSTLENVYHLS